MPRPTDRKRGLIKFYGQHHLAVIEVDGALWRIPDDDPRVIEARADYKKLLGEKRDEARDYEVAGTVQR